MSRLVDSKREKTFSSYVGIAGTTGGVLGSKARREVPAFLPRALRASDVGAWERDLSTGLIRCDETMAGIYGFSDEDAEAGISLSRFVERIHPDDRPVCLDKLAAVAERGGLSVMEYRIEPAPGVVRWVLSRGRYTRETTGQVRIGRGIVIDITASKGDGHVEDQAFFLSKQESGGSALEAAAAHAIAARGAIDEHDPLGTSALRAHVDACLWVIGRALAAELGGGADETVSPAEPLEDPEPSRH